MTIPHVCPMCLGWKQVTKRSAAAGLMEYETCPVCQGSGLVWSFELDAPRRVADWPICPACGQGHGDYTHFCPGPWHLSTTDLRFMNT